MWRVIKLYTRMSSDIKDCKETSCISSACVQAALVLAFDGGVAAERGVRSLHFDPIICGWTGSHWSWASVRVGSYRAWNCVHMWCWTSRSWRWGLSISLQNWKLLEFLRGLGFHTPAPLLPSDCCYPVFLWIGPRGALLPMTGYGNNLFSLCTSGLGLH